MCEWVKTGYGLPLFITTGRTQVIDIVHRSLVILSFFNVFLKAIKKAFRKRSAIQFEIQQILDSSDSDEDDALVYEDNSDMDKDYVEELNDNDESDMSSPDETNDNDENENLRTETKIDGHKQRKTQVFDNV